MTLLAFDFSVSGFLIISMIPISYSFSVELTFPTPEVVSNGMMVMISQLYGAILVSNTFQFILV